MPVLTASLGEREADNDGDFWADWDEDCHGLIEDQEDQYPDGFTYTCCSQLGDTKGCQVGTHVEKDTLSKRMRY